MNKEIVKTDGAPAPIGPYSQAVISPPFLFISGQIALDAATGQMIETDIKAETRKVMENLKAILQQAGYTFRNVVKTSIFLKDMNQFAEVNEVYATYFDEAPPARETVEVSRLPRDARVEISMIAVISYL